MRRRRCPPIHPSGALLPTSGGTPRRAVCSVAVHPCPGHWLRLSTDTTAPCVQQQQPARVRMPPWPWQWRPGRPLAPSPSTTPRLRPSPPLHQAPIPGPARRQSASPAPQQAMYAALSPPALPLPIYGSPSAYLSSYAPSPPVQHPRGRAVVVSVTNMGDGISPSRPPQRHRRAIFLRRIAGVVARLRGGLAHVFVSW